MWEPRRLTTLWAFTACYRDNFYIYKEVTTVNAATLQKQSDTCFHALRVFPRAVSYCIKSMKQKSEISTPLYHTGVRSLTRRKTPTFMLQWLTYTKHPATDSSRKWRKSKYANEQFEPGCDMGHQILWRKYRYHGSDVRQSQFLEFGPVKSGTSMYYLHLQD
jgi:hypothetical protein